MPTPLDPGQLLTLDARRICLIKPSALGDVVQTLPLLPVLRERFPRATVSWVVRSELAELLEGHPQLDEVIRFERRGPWGAWMELLRQLRQGEFDLVFDLQGLLRTAVMAAATRARVRVGLETAREGAHLACHCTVPRTGRDVPAHLRYWRVAEALGRQGPPPAAHVSVPEAVCGWADEQLAALGRPVLAIHAGAGWKTKRWPVEKFAAIAAKAARTYGFSTVLVGNRKEAPLAGQLAEVLRKFVPGASVADFSGRTPLKELAALLGRADVMLTNDSGPMHLAAALGTPVVGVFTCTSPVRSGPAGGRHEFVMTELSCAASYKKRCPYRGKKHMACLEEIATDRVWNALVRVVEKNRGPRRVRVASRVR